jgi:RNA polymerase sigma-70 factor, ECF subfamily
LSARLPLTEQNRASATEPESGPVPSGGVDRARPDGEFVSLREVFDDHAPFVWRTLRHLGVREADLPDVCQDVFLTVHRKIEGFEGRSSLRTWLYGICLRTASDHRRRAHVRRERIVAEPPPSSVGPTQHDDYERGEARRLLAELLDELDEDKRAVFVLYEIEELGMKEVAEIIGCPLQTAYSRLHAARKAVIEAGLRRRGEAP